MGNTNREPDYYEVQTGYLVDDFSMGHWETVTRISFRTNQEAERYVSESGEIGLKVVPQYFGETHNEYRFSSDDFNYDDYDEDYDDDYDEDYD